MNQTFKVDELFFLADSQYRDFMARLLPTVPKSKIIGVRMPELRKIAKRIEKSGRAEAFISSLPHTYYEEDAIHAYIIMEYEYEKCIFDSKPSSWNPP